MAEKKSIARVSVREMAVDRRKAPSIFQLDLHHQKRSLGGTKLLGFICSTRYFGNLMTTSPVKRFETKRQWKRHLVDYFTILDGKDLLVYRNCYIISKIRSCRIYERVIDVLSSNTN